MTDTRHNPRAPASDVNAMFLERWSPRALSTGRFWDGSWRTRALILFAAQPRAATMAKWASEMTCRTADLTFLPQKEVRGMSGKGRLGNGGPPGPR